MSHIRSTLLYLKMRSCLVLSEPTNAQITTSVSISSSTIAPHAPAPRSGSDGRRRVERGTSLGAQLTQAQGPTSAVGPQ